MARAHHGKLIHHFMKTRFSQSETLVLIMLPNIKANNVAGNDLCFVVPIQNLYYM